MDFKTAYRCAILSQEIYQDFAAIKFRDLPGITPKLIERGRTDTQLAILEDATQQRTVIVFRGSDAERDLITNLDFGAEEYAWSPAQKESYREQIEEVTEEVTESKELIYPDEYADSSRPVKMHRGFILAYLSVRNDIHDYIKNSSASQYTITGHSLGGALATLCAIDLQYNFSPRIQVEAYTFGSPKVGNAAFTESYNRRVPDTWRVVYGWDIVVGLPRWWQGYRHVDTAIKLERGFSWRIITGSVEDHRISKYVAELKTRAGAA
ncbi:MAG: lipase family protein [Leptolyngbya sp. SIO4C1]|nr:lipase family protein [Leptolyngbya sp. SIO4C1]